jgi:hypothetical protein
MELLQTALWGMGMGLSETSVAYSVVAETAGPLT